LSGNESSVRFGFDGILADHDAVITNPNMAMFSVTNFNAVDRDVHGAFVEWRADRERSDFEVGARYKLVRTDAGTVGATGMSGMMAMNVDMLAEAFNAADRSLEWRGVDAVVKYRYALSETTEWIVELGSKTRAPSYQELYLWLPLEATGGLADGRTYIGDLNLSDERSNEIVIGFTSDLDRFSISPQIYFRKIGNYIQGIPSTNMLANSVSMMMTGAPALQFANVDAEVWGADLAWKLTYTTGDWSIKPELMAGDRQDKVSTYNDEEQTPGFVRVNIAFAWHGHDSWRIEARVDNVFDKAYQDHLAGINRAAGSDIPQGVRLYGAETTLSAGVSFSF